MAQRFFIAAILLGATFGLFARADGQQGKPLIIGGTLPSLSAQTLTGKLLNLPSHSDNSVSVVVFSFSRAGGRDAQKWAQSFSKQESKVLVYTVIVLESVPRVFQPMAVSRIRNQMPLPVQDHTIILYRDEKIWERRLQITDESHACVILLDSGGDIQWLSTGPFTESLFQSLRKQMHALN